MANNQGDEDSFVAIDMESLLLLTSPTDPQSPSQNPRFQTYKSFSRKGSNQERERKAPEVGSTASTSGVEEICIESKLAISVTGDQGTSGAVTPIVSRSKRIGKRSSIWLDPRRVVVMFATLSSVGTLVLLYLTLSMVGS